MDKNRRLHPDKTESTSASNFLLEELTSKDSLKEAISITKDVGKPRELLLEPSFQIEFTLYKVDEKTNSNNKLQEDFTSTSS